mgnify:CR=1 FL=1
MYKKIEQIIKKNKGAISIFLVFILILASCSDKKTSKGNINHYEDLIKELPKTFELVQNEQKAAICLAINHKTIDSLPKYRVQLMLNNATMWTVIDGNKNIDGDSIENGMNIYYRTNIDVLLYMSRQAGCRDINVELNRFNKL